MAKGQHRAGAQTGGHATGVGIHRKGSTAADRRDNQSQQASRLTQALRIGKAKTPDQAHNRTSES